MANLTTKIILYLEANGKNKTELFPKMNVVATATEILSWNVDGVSKPTTSQLNSYESAGNTRDANDIKIASRISEYGTVHQQLEYIVENGIDEFIKKQKDIKDKYPKE